MEYDLFISHASEDKSSFVAPLAEMLQELGVKVWYDDFTLKMGDSLSRSIDRGLANSKYALVVLSKAFIEKAWTEYELRGLITREVGKEKVILPIWHEISKDEIIKFSPPLADKIAIKTDRLTREQVTLKIIEIVRPDIHTAFLRLAHLRQLLRDGKKGSAKISDLQISPIRHPTLPDGLLLRLGMVHQILEDVLDVSIGDFIENFQRDLQPQEELFQWELMASTYTKVIQGKRWSKAKRKDVFAVLLAASVQTLDEKFARRFSHLTYEEVLSIVSAMTNIVPKVKKETRP